MLISLLFLYFLFRGHLDTPRDDALVYATDGNTIPTASSAVTLKTIGGTDNGDSDGYGDVQRNSPQPPESIQPLTNDDAGWRCTQDSAGTTTGGAVADEHGATGDSGGSGLEEKPTEVAGADGVDGESASAHTEGDGIQGMVDQLNREVGRSDARHVSSMLHRC